MRSSSSSSSFHKVTVAVGTYDGVLAGWEITTTWSSNNNNKTKKEQQRPVNYKFQIAFASPVHGGSVRSLAVAGKLEPNSSNNSNANKTASPTPQPSTLISCGYDEVVKTHDMAKRLTQSGEIRTPPDFGTPVCSSFAPPLSNNAANGSASSTHCLIGFSTGKLVVYKKRDWSIQHVLAGHEGGISAMGVHPTGKLTLTGGNSDGKLKLWDLTKGRLAYVTKLLPAAASSAVQGRRTQYYDPVVSIVWSRDGSMYAVAHGSHVTVRDVATGIELLDVDLPSRINQICLIEGDNGIFCVGACNDGSLPVLAVNKLLPDGTTDKQVKAIMAIEPVDGLVAGEERFKCIQSASTLNYHVVTANSAGVVSLMSLQGAVRMILEDEEKQQQSNHDSSNENKDYKGIYDNQDEEEPVHPESDADSENDQDEELAVDIIDSVRLGTGARITCLVCWSTPIFNDEAPQDKIEEEQEVKQVRQSLDEAGAAIDGKKRKASSLQEGTTKRKREGLLYAQQQQLQQVTMDDEAINKARKLVKKAKKIQKRKEKKRKQKSTSG